MNAKHWLKTHPGIDWNDPHNFAIAWEAASLAEREACAEIAKTLSVNGIDVDVAFQQFGQPVVDGGSECGEFVQARPNEGRRRSPELPVAVDLVTK